MNKSQRSLSAGGENQVIGHEWQDQPDNDDLDLQPTESRRMNTAEYTLIDCTTGLSYGPFELVDRARHRAEFGNIAKWEIINRSGELVAWSKLEA